MSRTVRLTTVAAAGVLLGLLAYVWFFLLATPGLRQAPEWQLLASLPNARGEVTTAVANGKLWVIGGFTGLAFDSTPEVATFLPADNAWAEAPLLPAGRDHAAACATPDGTIYVSGGGAQGGGAQATFWSIRDGQPTWDVLAPMPEARLAHRMVVVGSRLYVVGGIGDTGRVLIYDPARRRWSAGAAMPGSRDHLAAVAVDGEIWAIGGRVDGIAQTRVDIYDPDADRWRAGPPLPRATSAAAEGLLGRTLFISGGEDPQVSERVIDHHWLLDTGAAVPTWLELSAPPLTVHGAQGAVIDGAFVIAGGASRPGGASRFAWSNLTQVYRPERLAQE